MEHSANAAVREATDAIVKAREAYDRQNIQLPLEEPEIGTCQRCGRYHDLRFVQTCPCGGYVG